MQKNDGPCRLLYSRRVFLRAAKTTNDVSPETQHPPCFDSTTHESTGPACHHHSLRTPPSPLKRTLRPRGRPCSKSLPTGTYAVCGSAMPPRVLVLVERVKAQQGGDRPKVGRWWFQGAGVCVSPGVVK